MVLISILTIGEFRQSQSWREVVLMLRNHANWVCFWGNFFLATEAQRHRDETTEYTEYTES